MLNFHMNSLSLVFTDTGGTSAHVPSPTGGTDSKPRSKPGKQEVIDSPPPVAPGASAGRRVGATSAEMFWNVVHAAPRESEKRNSGTKRSRR